MWLTERQANPHSPLQMKSRKSSQDLMPSVGGRSLGSDCYPCCAGLALRSRPSLCAAVLAHLLPAEFPSCWCSCLPECVPPALALHPLLWEASSYSACKVGFRLDSVYSLAGALRLTERVEMDCSFCTNTAALSPVNGAQKDKKHYPVRKELKTLLLDIDLSTLQTSYFSLN